MKTKLLFLTIIMMSMAHAQTILIPNGGFNTDTSGWSIAGTNTSISGSGELYINVYGIYTENFILTSPQFNLDASKAYKLHSDYRNVQYDIMMGEIPLGGFWDVYLKDVTGTTVANVGLSTCATGGYLDMCNSANFNVPTSGTYYLEFSGQHSQDAEFILDNVGFEEVIQNTFSGTVTLDDNNDGCVTSSTTIENFPVLLNETVSSTNYSVFTDANGDFNMETQNITGTFVTQTNHALYNATPASYSNTISSGVNNITNQDFCVAANTVANDVNISIIPTTQARPGFDTAYQVRYTNLGTTTLSGVVSLDFDNTMVTYLNASIAPDVTAATSLSWNYTSLMPFETRYIDVNFNIFTPPTVNNGDVLAYSASITPISGDYTPTNNTFVLNQITIGSYDPNDITILEGPLISTSQATDYLNVLIRFQNTGTASAINIVVENTLDAFLDWSTFQPIAASHNYSTVVSNGNEVDFIFNGINLADSTTDEPESHGWVYYKIKPIGAFAVGDIISDTAEIYFDYNLPIITNTATTQIDLTLSATEVSLEQFSVYPNPVNDVFHVVVKNDASYKVITCNGQTIAQGKLVTGENSVNTSNLSNGLFFLQIESSEGIATKKMIKQ